MPRKPAHEQFDTLKALGDQAFALFGRYGYEGVSIGDIAKASRLSKGALYWHYPGKDALYLDCLRRLHAVFNQYVFTPMQQEPDPARAMLSLFAGLERMMQDPRICQGVAGYWLVPSKPETEPILAAQRAFEEASTETVAAVLRRAQEQGQFNLGAEAGQMAHAIIALIEACVVPMRRYSTEEMHGIMTVLARTLFRAYSGSDDLLALVRAL